MTLCLSIFLLAMIIDGLLLIFKKDMVWRWAEISAKRNGVFNLERTPKWEILTTVGGIIIVVIAAIMLFIMITES